jgi:hemerythrin HHE cation binding domain-containing protein
MNDIDRRKALAILATTAGMTGPGKIGARAAESEIHAPGGKDMDLTIPGSLKAEHEELHEELVRITNLGAKTGAAAKAVAAALHAHFVKEEELAMPPLGLLPALAAGPVKSDMAKVVELTDKLKRELPTMLKEHQTIVGALDKLAEAAKAENKPAAEHFAAKLKQHAKSEEEVLYPAAIVVGEYVKLSLRK